MGVGRIFARGSRKDFSRGGKSRDISFNPLETKQTTVFAAKILIGNSKFRNPGGPPSDTHGCNAGFIDHSNYLSKSLSA